MTRDSLPGRDDVARTTLTLPVALARALKVQAAREGRSMNDIINELVREYLRNQPTR